METVVGIAVVAGFILVGIRQLSRQSASERERVEKANTYGDAPTRNRILEKKIWQGMTETQLLDSWGQPLGRSRLVLKTKVKQTYSYGSPRYGSKVYLENGIVVGWRQPR